MLYDLENADDESVILLHTCAHNPTGCDPTTSEWVSIANTIEVYKYVQPVHQFHRKSSFCYFP